MEATEALQQQQLDVLNQIYQRQSDLAEFHGAAIGQLISVNIGLCAALVMLFFIFKAFRGG